MSNFSHHFEPKKSKESVFVHQRNGSDCGILLNTKIYDLNKSGTKYVAVGLNKDFEPCVKIGGRKSYVVLTENEWKTLVEYQGCILNYFYSQDEYNSLEDFEKLKVFFEKISDNGCGEDIRLTKIFKNESYVYLGCETVSNLFQLTPLIDNTLERLNKQQFQNYLNAFRSSLGRSTTTTTTYGSDVVNAIYSVLLTRKDYYCENDSIMMELVLLHPLLLEQKLKI